MNRRTLIHMADQLFRAQDLYRVAAQKEAQANYPAAYSLYHQALSQYDETFGAYHPEACRCRCGLSRAANALGHFDEARRLVEQALELQNRILGSHHPDVAASLHTLGEIMANQEDYSGAIPRLEQAYRLRHQLLGPAHPDTLESLSILGLTWMRQGDVSQAARLLQQALSLAGQPLEASDVDQGERRRAAARMAARLGVVYASQNPPHPLALLTSRQALESARQAYGPDHPYTAQVMSGLGRLLHEQGRPEEALPLLEEALRLQEAASGTPGALDSLPAVQTLTNLSAVYLFLEQDGAAYRLAERALIANERIYGPRHALTLQSLRRVVDTLDRLARTGDPALDLAAWEVGAALFQCLAGLDAAAGRADPANANTSGTHLHPRQAARRLHEEVERLAAIRSRPPLSPADQAGLEAARLQMAQAADAHRQGNDPAALALLEQALAVQEHRLGPDDLEHVELLKRLVQVKDALGQWSAALPLLQRAADIRSRILGPHNPYTLESLTELTSRTSYEYGLAASLPLQRQVLELQEQALGPNDPNVKLLRRAIERLETQIAPLAVAGAPAGPGLSRSQKRERALAALPPERLALLEGIEQVNWRSLQHAYGPAVDVPNLLRLLLCADPEVVRDAWESLYAHIYHQGTIYQATGAAVPFLVRMLAADEPPGKIELLNFLADLAAEGSQFNEPPGSEAQNDWVRALEDAIAAGLPVYFDLLQHPQVQVRLLALLALARLRRRSGQVIPGLQEWLKTTRDPQLRAAGLYALRKQMDDSPASQQYFSGLLMSSADPLVGYQVAAGWVERVAKTAAPPSNAIAALRAARFTVANGRTRGDPALSPWIFPDKEDDPKVRAYLT